MLIETNPVQTLERDLNFVRERAMGTESFVKDQTNITRLSRVLDGLKETTALSFGQLSKTLQVPFKAKPTLNEKLSSNNYLDMTQLHIQVPYGLKTTFLNLAEILESHMPLFNSIEGQLQETQKYLLKLIGQKTSTAGTMRNRIYDDCKQRMKAFEEARDEIGGCFEKGSTKATSVYGKHFSRNSDWLLVQEKCEWLAKHCQKIDLKKILKEKSELEEYSKDLRASLEEGSGRELSAFMADEISTVIYSMARELEFLSSYLYFCNALTTTMQNNFDDLDQKLKK